MKNLAVILSLIIGFSAQANLLVGDNARYTVGMNGQNYELLNSVTVLDTSAGKFTVQQTVFQNGTQIQANSEQQDISDNDNNEAIFGVCMQMPSELNPRYETLSVLAGTFNTCHVTQSDSNGTITNIYFADVLFGYVKMTKEHSTDNSDVAVELKAFKKN